MHSTFGIDKTKNFEKIYYNDFIILFNKISERTMES